jgi:DNA-directed RNA polymerase subunit M/transcription elongation factor TFIIS
MAAIKESFIKCNACGNRFRSPIFFGHTAAFDSATTSGNKAQCPKCGTMINCNKDNMSYVLADDSGGAVGGGFGV